MKNNSTKLITLNKWITCRNPRCKLIITDSYYNVCQCALCDKYMTERELKLKRERRKELDTYMGYNYYKYGSTN